MLFSYNNYKCKFKRISDKLRGRIINGSLTEEERLIKRNRNGKWVKDIKIKYDYTCQKCGFKGKPKDYKLVSHHIESYKWNKEMMNDNNNGICLCIKCHNKFHKTYGQGKIKPNTLKQLTNFLKGEI